MKTSPASLSTADLDYALPEELIAVRPAEPRDAARLLVVSLSDGQVEHRRIRDLPEHLRAGDELIFNDTAVAPARLVGRRVATGGRVEGLFLGTADDGRWRLMLRSNGRLRPGDRVELSSPAGPGSAIELTDRDDDGATWIGRLVGEPRGADVVLEDVGRTPLPPYILGARKSREAAFSEDDDRAWYQTVYADPARRSSVAAPTAGLHFTPGLLAAVDAAGARRRTVTLHVGPGTFKPITTPTLEEHVMHREWYEVPRETVDALRDAPRRVVAVGTTSVRALESLPAPLPDDGAVIGVTDLLIAPPYDFRHVDALLTNFHLPRSTLLALVAALVGLDRLKEIYREAVREGYRFYSYGDAMLVLP